MHNSPLSSMSKASQFWYVWRYGVDTEFLWIYSWRKRASSFFRIKSLHEAFAMKFCDNTRRTTSLIFHVRDIDSVFRVSSFQSSRVISKLRYDFESNVKNVSRMSWTSPIDTFVSPVFTKIAHEVEYENREIRFFFFCIRCSLCSRTLSFYTCTPSILYMYIHLSLDTCKLPYMEFSFFLLRFNLES